MKNRKTFADLIAAGGSGALAQRLLGWAARCPGAWESFRPLWIEALTMPKQAAAELDDFFKELVKAFDRAPRIGRPTEDNPTHLLSSARSA
jgi:hypothetical protein